MQTCEECSKVYADLRDIEECDICYTFVCHSCVVEGSTDSQMYCSEECKARGD